MSNDIIHVNVRNFVSWVKPCFRKKDGTITRGRMSVWTHLVVTKKVTDDGVEVRFYFPNDYYNENSKTCYNYIKALRLAIERSGVWTYKWVGSGKDGHYLMTKVK